MATEKRLIDAVRTKKQMLLALELSGKDSFSKSDVEYSLDNASTVDAVEVVHGHKVVRERNRGIAYAMECPICNSKIPSNKPYIEKVEYCSVCEKKLDDTFQNYCPNCGAKMDLEAPNG